MKHKKSRNGRNGRNGRKSRKKSNFGMYARKVAPPSFQEININIGNRQIYYFMHDNDDLRNIIKYIIQNQHDMILHNGTFIGFDNIIMYVVEWIDELTGIQHVSFIFHHLGIKDNMLAKTFDIENFENFKTLCIFYSNYMQDMDFLQEFMIKNKVINREGELYNVTEVKLMHSTQFNDINFNFNRSYISHVDYIDFIKNRDELVFNRCFYSDREGVNTINEEEINNYNEPIDIVVNNHQRQDIPDQLITEMYNMIF